MIDEMIGEVNTDARKSRAYSLEAREYLLQQDEDKIDLDYFFQLLSNTEDINSDRLTPIILMSEMLASAEKLNSSALLPSIKAHFYFVENIESAKNRSIICMRIYLWFKKNFPEDTFASKVKRFLLQTWNSIDVVWYKIEIGFFMAKNFAKVSKEEACEMIDKCRIVKYVPYTKFLIQKKTTLIRLLLLTSCVGLRWIRSLFLMRCVFRVSSPVVSFLT